MDGLVEAVVVGGHHIVHQAIRRLKLLAQLQSMADDRRSVGMRQRHACHTNLQDDSAVNVSARPAVPYFSTTGSEQKLSGVCMLGVQLVSEHAVTSSSAASESTAPSTVSTCFSESKRASLYTAGICGTEGRQHQSSTLESRARPVVRTRSSMFDSAPGRARHRPHPSPHAVPPPWHRSADTAARMSVSGSSSGAARAVNTPHYVGTNGCRMCGQCAPECLTTSNAARRPLASQAAQMNHFSTELSRQRQNLRWIALD